MKLRLRAAAVLTLALMASACTSYKYIPPATEAGRQCVTTCETNQQICISGKEQVAASQTQACEMRRTMQLSNCMVNALTPQARAYCNKSVPACTSSFANTGDCTNRYRACYVQCGGQVIEVEN